MKNLTATICLAVALLLGSAVVSWSQDFQKCLTAAKSGDYATALRKFKPLANQGNAAAQFNLGWMYEDGEGISLDYKIAVKWFRLHQVPNIAHRL
jgi:TPR repeat protein